MATLKDPLASPREAPRLTQGVQVPRQVAPMDQDARALIQFGETIGKSAEQIYHAQEVEREKADTTRVEDAWNQYKGAAMGLTLGENGLLTKRGGDAVNGDLMKNATQGLADAKSRIMGTLGSDAQRQRFGTRADSTDLGVAHDVLQHLNTENRAYAESTFKGSVAMATANVGAKPMNELAFAEERAAVFSQADNYFRGIGLTDKNVIQGEKDKISDGLWAKRLDALAYDQPLVADALLRANEKEIKNPELKLQLQTSIGSKARSVGVTIDANAVFDEVRGIAPSPSQGSPLPVNVPDTGAVPRNLRNNNPGNIEKSNVRWQGQVEGDDSRFVRFASYEDGLKAMQTNLLTYQRKHGLNTVEGIIGRWASSAENGDAATKNYVKTVSKALGVKPGDPIDLTNPTMMQAMVTAMTAVESGGASGGQRPVSADSPTANTNGLPTSRDIDAQLPFMLLRVERMADRKFGTDLGNPDRAAWVSSMEQRINSRMASEVHQLNKLQRQAQGVLIDAILNVTPPGAQGLVQTGGQDGRNMITSFSQIQSNPTLMRAFDALDSGVKPSIINLIDRQLSKGEQGDVRVYRQVWDRIAVLPEGHPEKIYLDSQIIDPKFVSQLSTSQINELRAELRRQGTDGGRSFNQLRASAEADAKRLFDINLSTNINFVGTKLTNPDAALGWNQRWRAEVGKKMDDYIAAGQHAKVRQMFVLGSPESVIEPAYLRTFMTDPATSSEALAAQAKATRDGKAPPPPTTITTDEEWAKLPPGADFIRDGKRWKKNGAPVAPASGQPASQAAPAPAQPAAAPAPERPLPASTVPGATSMTATGKLVTAPAAPAPAKPKGGLPAFAGSINDKSPEYIAQHVTQLDPEALKYAVKETGRVLNQTLDPMVMARKTMDLFWGGVEKIKELPTAMRRESARAYWNDIIRKPQFFREDIPAIQEALKYGDLSPADRKKAKQLLKDAGAE